MLTGATIRLERGSVNDSGIKVVKRNAADGERWLMHRHGTERYKPTPRVVHDTARSDLATLRENAFVKVNKGNAKAAGASVRGWGKSKSTAFLAAHLRGAQSVSDVLRAAIKGVENGRRANSIETQIVYGCEHTLRAALDLATAAEAAGDRSAKQESDRGHQGPPTR